MRITILAAGLVALLTLSGLSFAAPPWERGSGHDPGRHSVSAYGDRDEGGPPPWAPAHGYRRKHDEYHGYDRGDDEGHHADDDRVTRDFGIAAGTCNRESVGAFLGGVVGAAVGSQVGSREDRPLTVVAGTVIGVLVGRSIGRSMDAADQACTGQVLERAADRQRVTWSNPNTGVRYQVVPTGTYRSNGRYCRKYVTHAVFDGSTHTLYGTACRNADGSWQMNSSSNHG